MNRKKLTLPSGATTEIRKLSQLDFASIGKYPDTTKPAQGDSEPTPEQTEYGIAVAKLAAVKGCGHYYSQGRLFKIVDKPHYELEKAKTFTEVCIEEIEQADFDMIVREVLELTQIGKEAAQAAASFPEKPANGGDGAPGS